MPLRTEHRQYYGRSWRSFRLELIAKHGPVCSQCGVIYGVGINGAHKTHDPRDHSQAVLMCPSCHAEHDAPHRIAIMRRRKSKARGQLWLLPELEYAPFASWEIPGWIYDRMIQLRLFDGQ